MKRLNNKELYILEKYNCDLNKMQELIDISCPMYEEISIRKIALCLPYTTSMFEDNNRQELIRTIMRELTNE